MHRSSPIRHETRSTVLAYAPIMSSIPGRSATALLVIDVQKAVVANAYRRTATIANIHELVLQARRHHLPVIWVQHSDEAMPIGSDDWQIVDELDPTAGEPLVRKRFRSSFEDTELESLLADRHVGHLVVSGAQSEFCVRHTITAALERGYDVTLVADAHTTEDTEWADRPLAARDIIADQNRACWQYELPGRSCSLTSTEDAFAALSL